MSRGKRAARRSVLLWARRPSRAEALGDPARRGRPAEVWQPPFSPAAAWLAYGLPVLLTTAATFAWFRGGRFIASGDVAPFVRTNLRADVTSLWNHQVTGAGSTSYAITQLPEVMLLRLCQFVGLSEQVAQHLLYALVCGFAAFGVSYLIAVWVRRPWPVAAGGLVVLFNSFVLVSFPNLLPSLSIGLCAVLAGEMLRTAAGRRPRPGVFALLTLPVCYLAQNPPLVLIVAIAVLAVALGASVLAAAGGLRRCLRLLAVAALPVLLVNAFWWVPYLLTLGSSAGLTMTAQTDVQAWGWTQVRASIGNVLTLNTHWGWTDPEYFPYADSLSHGWHGALRWLLPVVAAAGLLGALRRRRRVALTLLITVATLVLVGKGLHPPFGWINAWCYAHVPGMWLLRDPMSKVGVLLVICYAIGVAFAVESLLGLAPRIGAATARLPHGAAATRASHVLWRGMVGAVVVLALAYPSPLYTGAVVDAAHAFLPDASVGIPAGWRDIASRVNQATALDHGKVAVFPLDPYYQITTNWGYHGVDEVPAQLLSAPVLQQLPGGYFAASDGVRTLLQDTETALTTGDSDNVVSRLRALGVSTVIVRHDLIASPDLPVATDPELIEATMRRVPGLRLLHSDPLGDAYQIEPFTGAAEAPELVAVHSDETSGVSATIAGLPESSVTTTDSALPADEVSWQVAGGSQRQSFTLAHPGTYRVSVVGTDRANYRVQVAAHAGSAVLRFTDSDHLALDGTPIPTRPTVTVPLTTPDVIGVTVGSRTVALAGASEGQSHGAAGQSPIVSLRARTAVTAFALRQAGPDLIPAFSDLGDCNRFDNRTPTQAGLGLTRSAGGSITLTAVAHTACTSAPVPFAGAGTDRLRLAYRTASGEPPRLCLWQARRESCVALQVSVAQDGGWWDYTGIGSVPDATGLRLYLYADGADTGAATAVSYRQVAVDALRVAGSAVVNASSAPTALSYLNAGQHLLSHDSPVAATLVRGFSDLADCLNAHGFSPSRSGLSLSHPAPGVVMLGASSDAACVTAAPVIHGPSSEYHLSLDYRTLAGRPARICLWQIGPDTCAETPDLITDSNWNTMTANVHIRPGTTGLQLYLYADGQRTPRTVVEYRAVAVVPAAPVTVVVSSVSPSAHFVLDPSEATGAPVTVRSSGPSSYRIDVTAHDSRTAVVVPESFAPGWRLRGLPRGWSARHFEAEGYANGWLITGRGTARLTAYYAPGHLARAALWLSLVTGLSVLAAIGFIRFAGFRRARLRRPAC